MSLDPPAMGRHEIVRTLGQGATGLVEWGRVAAYLVLACALLWGPFFAARADAAGGPWRGVLAVVGPFGPLLAALALRLWTGEGLAGARLGLRAPRLAHWLLALLLPFFWNSVQDGLLVLTGAATVEWSAVARGLYRIPINLGGGLLIFIGEEFGWRSYLLEHLRPLGRFRALLLSGVAWSVWHAPLVLLPGFYASRSEPGGTLLALALFVLFGFIFGWLYLESGSVWPCVLMHSWNNLVSMKLLREAWAVTAEPSLLDRGLMALGPVLLVWGVLLARGGFRGRGVS